MFRSVFPQTERNTDIFIFSICPCLFLSVGKIFDYTYRVNSNLSRILTSLSTYNDP